MNGSLQHQIVRAAPCHFDSNVYKKGLITQVLIGSEVRSWVGSVLEGMAVSGPRVYVVVIVIASMTMIPSFLLPAERQVVEGLAPSMEPRSSDMGRSDMGERSSLLDPPTTSMRLGPDDMGWISERSHVHNYKGSFLKLDDKALAPDEAFPASYLSTYQAATSRVAQSYEGTDYVAFMTVEGTAPKTVRAWLAVSSDDGATFGTVEVQSFSGASEGSVDLLIYQDKLFYMAAGSSVSPPMSAQSIRITNYMDWRNISSAPSLSLGVGSKLDETCFSGAGSRVYFLWKPTGYARPNFRVYDNGTWGPEGMLPYQMYTFCAAALTIGGVPNLMVIYPLGTSRDGIVQMATVDGGDTWSSVQNVIFSSRSVNRLSCVEEGGVVHVAVNFVDDLTIGYFAYDGSTPSTMTLLATYEENEMDPDTKELTISADAEGVMIAFEDGPGKISLLGLLDNGKSLEAPLTVGDGQAHCPSMDTDRNLLLFQNGTSMEVHRFLPPESGSIRSEALSVPGISSWDGFAIIAGGVRGNGSVEFRLMSEDLSIQFFPATGWKDLGGTVEASLGGVNYPYSGDLSGLFASGPYLETRIVLELRLNRLLDTPPLISAFLLNYTVSYPYREAFTHMTSALDCVKTSIGLELDPDSTSGTALVGPFQTEDRFPDHLAVKCSFVDDDNYIMVYLRTGNDLFVPGFAHQDAQKVTQGSGEVYLEWSGKGLSELPPEVHEFFIELELHRSGVISPKVQYLDLSWSEAPRFLGMGISDTDLLRGDGCVIYFDLADREEDLSRLSLRTELFDPVQGIWTDEHLSDPYFSAGRWRVDLHTDMEVNVGTYRIRAEATDVPGMGTGLMEFEKSIVVRNNPPYPPVISLDPASVFVDSALNISMLMPGEDKETPVEMLLYDLYVEKDGIAQGSFKNLSEASLLLDALDTVKGDGWRIEARTWDGINESAPYVISFTVGDSPPEPSDAERLLELEEDSERAIDLRTYVSDKDGDALMFRCSGPDWLTRELTGHVLNLVPDPDRNGVAEIEIVATDGSSNVSFELDIIVKPVNDPPSWSGIERVEAREDEWTYIEIGAVDAHDDETVTVDMPFEDLQGLVEGRDIMRYPNGSFWIRPLNAMVGEHDITFSISDSSMALPCNIIIDVINVNDPPSRPTISVSTAGNVLQFGQEVGLSASSTDEDIIWGDVISYWWSSNISGPMGSGPEINVTLVPGTHLITVNVSDAQGAWWEDTVELTVMPEEVEEAPVIRTWQLYSAVCCGAFFISALMVLTLLFIIVLLTKKKGGKGAEAPSEDAKEKQAPPPPPSDLGPTLSRGPAQTQLGTGKGVNAGPERVLPPAQNISGPGPGAGPKVDEGKGPEGGPTGNESKEVSTSA